MLSLIKKIIPKTVKRIVINFRMDYLDGYSTKCYSQEGEDMILKRIFSDKVNGFYIDIGAHHPYRFSNTNYFYKRGWRGINIDAMPGSMDYFARFRPRDINLEIPVGTAEELLTYFIFNEPALNSFDAVLSKERDESDGYKIVRKIQLRPQKLSTILDKYCPPAQKIDFISIDVEGLDLDILKSNNWEKYCPQCILIEIIDSTIESVSRSEIAIYLAKYGYIPFAKAFHTVIFIRSDFINTH